MASTPPPAAVTAARQMSQGDICCYLNKVILDLSYLLSVEDFMSKFLFLVREEMVGICKCRNACTGKTVCADLCSWRQKQLQQELIPQHRPEQELLWQAGVRINECPVTFPLGDPA